MNIIDFLSSEKFKTRQELVDETGLSDRVVRKKISDLKLVMPVIFNSQTKGYRLPKDLEKMTYEELQEELKLIQHSINDLEARKRVFNNQERNYIAYIKRAEKMGFIIEREEI